MKAAFKAAGSTAKQVVGHTPDKAFLVLPENWPVVELMKAVHTQWVYGPHGRWVGYNYAAVDIAMKRLSIDESLFQKLQIVEHAILDALDKQRKEK